VLSVLTYVQTVMTLTRLSVEKDICDGVSQVTCKLSQIMITTYVPPPTSHVQPCGTPDICIMLPGPGPIAGGLVLVLGE